MINNIRCTPKVLTDLRFTKQKIKIKNGPVKVLYSFFGCDNVLVKHKKDCLRINGKQTVKLEKVIIEFENYADFECN